MHPVVFSVKLTFYLVIVVFVVTSVSLATMCLIYRPLCAFENVEGCSNTRISGVRFVIFEPLGDKIFGEHTV